MISLHEYFDPVGLLQARAAITGTLRRETEAISADLWEAAVAVPGESQPVWPVQT